MPNQYTSKKAKEAARKEREREKQKPIPEVVRIDVTAALSDLLAKPLANKTDEKAKTLPHFTLLPSDNFTPVLVKKWIELAVAHNVPEEKVLEAKAILRKIEEWRTSNPTNCKTPD